MKLSPLLSGSAVTSLLEPAEDKLNSSFKLSPGSDDAWPSVSIYRDSDSCFDNCQLPKGAKDRQQLGSLISCQEATEEGGRWEEAAGMQGE